MYEEFAFRNEDWGHLADRYRDPAPRKLLALDGGGMRGVLTLRVLRRIEDLVGAPMSGYFDYIAGTSTGALIAGCLAVGMRVEEIESFYTDFGKVVFKKRVLPMQWFSRYQAGPLESKIRSVLSDATSHVGGEPDLRPEYLQCLFMAVLRNASTDSVWPISSNPAAMFNDPRDSDCNLKIPLWEILRASSAAPTFFPPHPIVLSPRRPESAFAFVDGGTTAYNNPSFLLYRMATADRYNLRWATGESQLLLVSIGSGTVPAPGQLATRTRVGFAQNVETTLKALLFQASVDQDTNCRIVGRCFYGDEVSYELGDLVSDGRGEAVPSEKDIGRSFRYLRYNVRLDDRGLCALGACDLDLDVIRRLDAVSAEAIDQLRSLGDTLAAEVTTAHFGRFISESP